MANSEIRDLSDEEMRQILTGSHPSLRRGRRFFGMLPSNPRCKFCNAPFTGAGGFVMRMLGRVQFDKNPNFCNICLTYERHDGIEIEITMLFADVRGSTTLAEGMGPTEFTRLMNRFFDAAMHVLVRHDAWIDRLVGDEVVSLFVPGFAGKDHARQAIHTAQELLQVTGHADKDGPWIPIGVGVHTGVAYVGMVGSEGGVSDMTAMGDNMNITARLTSLAKPGEVLVSEAALRAASMDPALYEHRRLDLKGRVEPVDVRVLRAI